MTAEKVIPRHWQQNVFMKKPQNDAAQVNIPTLLEFADLIPITKFQQVVTLVLPFLCVVSYFCFAFLGWWILAVFSLMFLSFITYGSTSHDLVHGNLGLRRSTNNFFLCAIELLALRSGHAYRLAHLHHHARYPEHDDIEGAAAKMSLIGALAEGVTYNLKLYLWALKRARRDKLWIWFEGAACIFLIATAIFLSFLTTIFLIYAILMIMGSWVLPLMTSYMPHNPKGENPMFQTRLFRGRIASLIAMEHLYHLEHHLYPSIPHHNWAQLAKRLDPVFEENAVKPIKIWF